MKTTTALTILTLAVYCFSPAHAVTFEWATVGNPGNADDTHGAGYGGVDYSYRISKHAVTNAQYTEFLNAVAATDTNGLYSTLMGLSTRGGITRSGVSGSYTYSVKPDAIGKGPGGADGDDYPYGNKPVVEVSFFDAMRFTNWLENGQPTGAQDASTTEDGVYNIGNGTNEVRNPNATYFIPTKDEWYKAAYHKDDGVTGHYWGYPTATNLTPNNNLPGSDTGNSANFWEGDDYTTGDQSYPMTDVGAYTESASAYGTFDQGGNVWEWNEPIRRSSWPGVHGGSWSNESIAFHASSQGSSPPSGERPNIGFRVASIPEPSTLLLAAMAAAGLLLPKTRGRLLGC